MGLEVISVVTTAAPSYDLVALADVHQYQGIPGSDTATDTFIAGAITRASTAIQTYCNRSFAVETITDTFLPERDSYPWQMPGSIKKLNLSRWPVTAITSVTSFADPNNPQTLTLGQDYLADNKLGQLIRLNPNVKYPTLWEAAQIVAVYQAGYTTIPADIQDACLRMISSAMKGRGRDPMLKSITQAGVTKDYWVDLGGRDGNFPPEVAQILDAYRVPMAR
jgi:hypothetical protein